MSMSMSSTMSGMPTASASAGMSMSSSMTDMGMMMTFNTNNNAIAILSSSFTPTTTAQYAGAWFFCFILAVIWRALVLVQIKLDHHWVESYKGRSIVLKGGEVKVDPVDVVQAWRLSTNVPRAALNAVVQGLAYLLMIIVMVMNVGLFFAVVVGYFVGEVIFGRVGSHFASSNNC